MLLPFVNKELSVATAERFQRDFVGTDKSVREFIDKYMAEIQEENPHIAEIMLKIITAHADEAYLAGTALACVYTYRVLKEQLEINELESLTLK